MPPSGRHGQLDLAHSLLGHFVLVQTGPEIFELWWPGARRRSFLLPRLEPVTVGDSGENDRVIGALGGA